MTVASVPHHNQLFFCLPHCTLQNGRTPLYVASVNGDKDVAQLLLDHGADVNIADSVRISLLSMHVHAYAVQQF